VAGAIKYKIIFWLSFYVINKAVLMLYQDRVCTSHATAKYLQDKDCSPVAPDNFFIEFTFGQKQVH